MECTVSEAAFSGSVGLFLLWVLYEGDGSVVSFAGGARGGGASDFSFVVSSYDDDDEYILPV